MSSALLFYIIIIFILLYNNVTALLEDRRIDHVKSTSDFSFSMS